MGMPGFQELLVILLIVLVLFGAKKIPELMKGLGSGIRNFKKELSKDDDEETQAQTTVTNAQQNIEQNKAQQQTTTTNTTPSPQQTQQVNTQTQEHKA